MIHGLSEDGLFLMGQPGLLCHTPGDLRTLLEGLPASRTMVCWSLGLRAHGPQRNSEARGTTSPYPSLGPVNKCSKVKCDHDPFPRPPRRREGKNKFPMCHFSRASSPIPQEKRSARGT